MSSGRLTTHVLDTASGRPAADLAIELYALGPDAAHGDPIGRFRTNADGRVDQPLLEGDALAPGLYELRFHVADYFGAAPCFYETVPVRFKIEAAASHYHVPLLISPFGYATYRGS